MTKLKSSVIILMKAVKAKQITGKIEGDITMRFKDIVSSVNNRAEKQYDELEKRVTRASRQYERYDDQQLVEKYRNSSGETRAACAMAIKKRRNGSN